MRPAGFILVLPGAAGGIDIGIDAVFVGVFLGNLQGIAGLAEVGRPVDRGRAYVVIRPWVIWVGIVTGGSALGNKLRGRHRRICAGVRSCRPFS
jgi:hypothetical protein